MAQQYDMVRARNVGDKPFVGDFASVRYVLQPGKDVFVPFDAAALWFGHPDVFDVGPRQMARTEMYKRLRLKYGAYDDTDADGNRTSSDEKWEQNRPRVEVYTLDGQRLNTVIDDPSGTAANPVDPDLAEQRGILARLQAVEAESQMLRAALAAKTKEAGDHLDDNDAIGGPGETVGDFRTAASQEALRDRRAKEEGRREAETEGEDVSKTADDDESTPSTSSQPAPGPIPKLLTPDADRTPDAEPDRPTRPGVKRP